jgi:hypothetical protein
MNHGFCGIRRPRRHWGSPCGAPALLAAKGRGARRDERMDPMPPTALSGPKGPATPSARAIGRSLRHVPSRSALAAPPLRLAALRHQPLTVGAGFTPARVAAVLAVVREGINPSPTEASRNLYFSRGPFHPGSPFRACGSRAPLKEIRPAFARRATGGCPAPVPRAPDVRPRRCARRCATSRAQRGPRPVILEPLGARIAANRR